MSLRDDLLRADAYPVSTSCVELRETHISWVFLLDRDVYKVKRPVSLGFVDFERAEQRHAACEAEARLNARLSPQVYRGVVPVRVGPDGRHRVGGSGPIADWAVHMQRMPDESRADRMLASAELRDTHVDDLATRLADFHAAARCDALTSRYGSPEAIGANVEENFAQTRHFITRFLAPDQATEVVRWQREFLSRHDDLFRTRVAAGRVRDGHGDLRLDQIYLGRAGTPTILDCIEFNERFRFADVCADVAFLSMDLASHGRVDLAERLLATYAREANDFDLYALVDFYESYRAFVRAKVSGMLAEDEHVELATRQRAEAEARRYFLLALSADRRQLLTPAVVAVGGVIASGKSTIAERVGGEISAPVIDADRTRKAMMGVEPTQPLDEVAWQGAYDPSFTEQVYEEVVRRARVVLASGRPVVLDASFRSRSMRHAARELAREFGAPFTFIDCRADAETCRSRLRAREHARGVSDGRLAVFDAFCARFEPVNELPPTELVVVDTTRPLDESLASVHARLEVWPAGLVA
jgi:aminoglycoside phosphotransferase family enzyme/predicted kinase